VSVSVKVNVIEEAEFTKNGLKFAARDTERTCGRRPVMVVVHVSI
jgi:hypothetical protein